MSTRKGRIRASIGNGGSGRVPEMYDGIRASIGEGKIRVSTGKGRIRTSVGERKIQVSTGKGRIWASTGYGGSG